MKGVGMLTCVASGIVWVRDLLQSWTEYDGTANPHPPQIKDEAAQKPKRTIFLSLIRGGGRGVQIFHLLFCPRL